MNQVKGHMDQFKGQVGQGQPKGHNIGRWAHVNVKLHFFLFETILTFLRTSEYSANDQISQSCFSLRILESH